MKAIEQRPAVATRAADPARRRGLLTTDYWNPPTSERQRARQRLVTVVLAIILAAVLTQLG